MLIKLYNLRWGGTINGNMKTNIDHMYNTTVYVWLYLGSTPTKIYHFIAKRSQPVD